MLTAGILFTLLTLLTMLRHGISSPVSVERRRRLRSANDARMELNKAISENSFSVPTVSDSMLWPEYWKLNIQGYFSNFSGVQPILFYPMRISPAGFGNFLGNYLEAVSCAQIAQVDFVGFELPENQLQPSARTRITRLMIKSLESLIQPPRYSQSLNETSCFSTPLPWTQPRSSQFRNIRMIKDLLQRYNSRMSQSLRSLDPDFNVITDFVTVLNAQRNISILNASTSQSTFQRSMNLPFIPEVAVLFRCTDVLAHGGDSPYGFVNFNVYYEVIPQTTASIYILTEALDYGNIKNVQACVELTTYLAQILSHRCPNATVTVRRGHSEAAFLQLSEAKMVISPPSTYGFYATVAQSDYCSAYFPETSLIAGGDEDIIGPRFHWFSFPRLVQFGDYIKRHGQNISYFKEMLVKW
jgi:hypothetical protein